MGDLLAAATKQIEYAGNEFASGDTVKGQSHLDKAAAFIQRAAGSTAEAPPGDTEAPAPAAEWSGTFMEALDKFIDALEAKQKADGVEVLIRGSYSGHGYTRQENIDLAKSIGVLDELGGDDFFGPLVPGSTQ